MQTPCFAGRTREESHDTLELDGERVVREKAEAALARREGPRDRKLLEGITALGQELQMQVLAEGVETERQLRFVEEIGVDLVQGYLLGRPRDPGEVGFGARARPERGETG